MFLKAYRIQLAFQLGLHAKCENKTRQIRLLFFSYLQLSAMLGVYQRLVGSTSHDVQAFALLGALIVSAPKQALEPFLQQVFVVIFRRLQLSKTEKFMKGKGFHCNFSANSFRIFICSANFVCLLIHSPSVIIYFLWFILTPFVGQRSSCSSLGSCWFIHRTIWSV